MFLCCVSPFEASGKVIPVAPSTCNYNVIFTLQNISVHIHLQTNAIYSIIHIVVSITSTPCDWLEFENINPD